MLDRDGPCFFISSTKQSRMNGQIEGEKTADIDTKQNKIKIVKGGYPAQ